MGEFTAELAKMLAASAHVKITEDLLKMVKTQASRGSFSFRVTDYEHNLDNEELFEKVKRNLEKLGFKVENIDDFFELDQTNLIEISWR